jgi:hypothetical protein
MDGRSGSDEYRWNAVKESTGAKYDTVVHFDGQNDAFRTPAPFVFGVDDAVTDGRLRTGTFDKDLKKAVGAEDLGAAHALVFNADQGDLAGEWFLVVDCNGVAGYQAKKDLVVHLEDPSHLDELDLGNFPNPL